MSGTDPVIGIDLGTTNSVAARCDDTGAPVVLVYRSVSSTVTVRPASARETARA